MRALASILAILAIGCPSDDDNNNKDAGQEPEVELGTGTVSFEALAEGDELEIVPGPQGGFHFHVHARMRGLDPGDPSMPGLLENPSTTFAAFLESGEQIDFMFPPYRLGYIEISDGRYELPSGRLLNIQDEQVPAIYGQRVRLTLTVTDDSGRNAETELTVVAVEQAGGAADAGVDGSSMLDL